MRLFFPTYSKVISLATKKKKKRRKTDKRNNKGKKKIKTQIVGKNGQAFVVLLFCDLFFNLIVPI